MKYLNSSSFCGTSDVKQHTEKAAHGESSQPEWTMRRHCIVHKILFGLLHNYHLEYGDGSEG